MIILKNIGHYVLSDKSFLDIKPDINDKIKKTIKNKLGELFNDK